MVAGSNLSWQGMKRKAVYTGRECKIATAQVHKFPHMGKFMHLIRKFYNQSLTTASS